MPASEASAAPGLLSRLSTIAANLVKVTTTKALIGQTPRQVRFAAAVRSVKDQRIVGGGRAIQIGAQRVGN